MSRHAGTVTSRRRGRRFETDKVQSRFIEFELEDGSHWMQGVTEISSGGIRFKCPEGRPAPEVGTLIDPVTLHVGGAQIHGSVRVAHVTSARTGDPSCGAKFVPATGADKRTMDFLVYIFEKRHGRAE